MAKIKTKRLVVFDLETGGLNPDRDAVLQVGALALDERLELVGEFEVKVRFDAGSAAPAALLLNSFEPGAWEREAVPERDAARRFAEFLKGHATLRREGRNGKPYYVAQLAAYNAAFDGPFLQAWYERLGEFLPADFKVLCLLQRVQWALVESTRLSHAPESLKLGTVCAELGIPLGGAAHDALADARATGSLYRVLHGLAPLPLPAGEAARVATLDEAPRWRQKRPKRRAKFRSLRSYSKRRRRVLR